MAFLSGVTIILISALLAMSIDSSSSGEYSGLLSSLYKKASEHKRPLILVLDSSKGAKQEEKPADPAKHVHKHKHHDSSHEDDSAKLVKLLQMLQLKQKKASLLKESLMAHKHTHEKAASGFMPRDRKPRLRSSDHQHSDEKSDAVVQPGSPVVKSFLRMANNLRCAARDECKNECDNASTCEETCDEEYKCEEERKPCHDCGKTTCNMCSDAPPTTEGCTGSTAGEEYYTEKAKCPRC